MNNYDPDWQYFGFFPSKSPQKRALNWHHQDTHPPKWPPREVHVRHIPGERENIPMPEGSNVYGRYQHMRLSCMCKDRRFSSIDK